MAFRSRTSILIFLLPFVDQLAVLAACATASAVILTIPRAVTDGTITCTGLDTPSRSGPTSKASVAADNKVNAILAASRVGITKRLAEPVSVLLDTTRERSDSLK